MSRFQDRAVIVTGIASGFGKAIAAKFAAEGARIVGADLDEAGGVDVVEELNAAGHKAVFIKTNVARTEDIQAMVACCMEHYGAIDVLVNNAGYSHMSKLLWKISEEEFDGVFDVNVKGVFLGCKYAIPHMIEAKRGVIINTASIGAIAPRPGVTPYNATKGAVVTMTKGLALELARNNIRCNAVNPVAAETGFMKGAMGVDKLTDEQKGNLVSTIPRGRLSEPEDIANAVCFLASDEADMITGTCLNVDGGRSI
jgi:3-oxoacyl-[acyl-carrier protein] reductase